MKLIVASRHFPIFADAALSDYLLRPWWSVISCNLPNIKSLSLKKRSQNLDVTRNLNSERIPPILFPLSYAWKVKGKMKPWLYETARPNNCRQVRPPSHVQLCFAMKPSYGTFPTIQFRVLALRSLWNYHVVGWHWNHGNFKHHVRWLFDDWRPWNMAIPR